MLLLKTRGAAIALVLVGSALLLVGTREANALVISGATEATLGGMTFQEGDLVDYNKTTDTTTVPVLFDGDVLFSLGENIDAVHFVDSDNIILSTQNGATLGGLTFADGDLVSYNLQTDIATLFFSESLFSAAAEDINAASILANGHIVLSTTTEATLGGLTFGPGDLADYDPIADTAKLFFDGDLLFSLGENIDAVQVMQDGSIILSTDNDATLGGLTFDEATLVNYNPLSDTAAVFLDSSKFSGAENIDAFAVPEPSTFTLLGLGLVLLRRRRA